MAKRAIDDLKIHPFNIEVYGEPDDGLRDSLEQFGLEYPIEIDPEGRILSGARRWRAAKELGWQEIEVRVREPESAEDARKHILLANAYRAVKTMFVRQKETDAYRNLLDRGEITKDDLASLAKHHGKTPTTSDDLKPQRLAAAAAGISSTTYQQAAFVTDPSRGEAEIDRAKAEGLISSGQASSLKRKIRKTRQEFRQDKVSADRAASEVRGAIRQAKLDHGYTQEERAAKAANEAGMEAVRRGKAFVSAIERLQHKQYAKHLGPRIAFILAGTLYEAGQALRALAKKGDLTLPTGEGELQKHAKSGENL